MYDEEKDIKDINELDTDGVLPNKINRFSDEAFKTGDEEDLEVPVDEVVDDEFSVGFQADADEERESSAGETN
ncbi:hypothetical protein A3J61_00860 [Candidatus Nomurabacteria bacterium RIFCSPHIGHO2_02_FULL_38_15]|uniref:Uncharacterized protein n=1 Tax=Candidatus Nomurabacteria bacterium RIFCSPHIGHO2_02_FULL_38_15 TaxID=1801752 RepID=A0A1F6VSE4_9BACT|nr:MAG: hypothetical protein A3J61_00860 [Candidatus Nomurabacteria bacterium RIFCSPHIGHO2_02_FULL_38_15]